LWCHQSINPRAKLPPSKIAIFRVLELKTLKMEVEAVRRKKGVGVFIAQT
jgi:hypothetical protein